MKFIKNFSIILLLLCVILCGTINVCAKSSDLNVITQVQVICHRGNSTVNRIYVQPHKIEAVLNYLRLLKCKGAPDTDPEQMAGDSYEIILYDAGGQCSIYRQRANRFFSKNSQPWKNILPEQASLLYPLVQSIPTDVKNAE